ncbi:MAG: cytochrome c family protein, partial [bacterium]|nr:cytochrome c family protein [bacterium]
SSALKDFGDGKNWDYATLNGFLYKPKKYVKGTAMGFPGLKKTTDRANIIAYMRSMADTPAPLPEE